MKKNQSVIVGIGATDYSLDSGRTTLSLAVDACNRAIEDSGLDLSEVDGILTFNTRDSTSTESIGTSLALPNVNYVMDYYAGGFAPSMLVQLADLFVKSNTCHLSHWNWNTCQLRSKNTHKSIQKSQIKNKTSLIRLVFVS